MKEKKKRGEASSNVGREEVVVRNIVFGTRNQGEGGEKIRYIKGFPSAPGKQAYGDKEKRSGRPLGEAGGGHQGDIRHEEGGLYSK